MSIKPADGNSRPDDVANKFIASEYANMSTEQIQSLNFSSSIQSLVAAANANIYDIKPIDTSSSSPKLPSPQDGKRQSPIEPAVQNLVSGMITKYITQLLVEVSSPAEQAEIFNHLILGKELTNDALSPKATKIKDLVEQNVRAEARLPNFRLQSLYTPQSDAWVQTPLKAYSSSEQQKIMEFYEKKFAAIVDEEVSLNPKEYPEESVKKLNDKDAPIEIKALKKIATLKTNEATIAEFGLPEFWQLDRQDAANWKPINKGELSVQNVVQARKDYIDENSETVASNYIDVIISALYEMRDIVNEKLLLELEQTSLFTEYKREQTEQSAIVTDQQAKDMARSQKLSRALGVFTKITMVIGIVVSVAAAVLTVASMGILAPVAVAAVAVTLAMATYSVVDYFTGVTATVFEGINDVIDDMTAGLPDGVSTAVKVALVAFTVVAAAAFIALSGGSSAGAVGSVAGTQLTKAILKESARVAVRQLTMQAALIVVMGSGILVEIPQEILKKTGLDESLQNKLSIAILIVEILAVMTVSAKVSASMFDISGRQPATSANQLSTLEKIKQSAKGFQEEINRTIDGMKTSLQSSLNTLRHPLTYIKSLRGKARNLGSAIIDIPKDIIASTMPDVDRTAKAYLRLKAANRLGQITNAATGVVNSAGKMVYQFLIYDVTKGLGDTEEEIARLRALLDAIDETISNFQKDISSDAAIYDSFATSVTKMLRQFTQTTETIFNSQG